jgi:hypothetical protein
MTTLMACHFVNNKQKKYLKIVLCSAWKVLSNDTPQAWVGKKKYFPPLFFP